VTKSQTALRSKHTLNHRAHCVLRRRQGAVERRRGDRGYAGAACAFAQHVRLSSDGADQYSDIENVSDSVLDLRRRRFGGSGVLSLLDGQFRVSKVTGCHGFCRRIDHGRWSGSRTDWLQLVLLQRSRLNVGLRIDGEFTCPENRRLIQIT
jgi:hypothetical protein